MMTENRRLLRPPVLPADFAKAHPDLAKLISELATHRAAARQVNAERQAVEIAKSVARLKDEGLLTTAVRAGQPDPGEPNADAIHFQLGQLADRMKGLRLAIAATERDLVRLHTANAAEWTDEAHDRASKAREDAAVALEAMRQAFAAVTDADTLTAWCTGNKTLPLGVPAYGSRMRGSVMSLDDVLGRLSQALVIRAMEPDNDGLLEAKDVA